MDFTTNLSSCQFSLIVARRGEPLRNGFRQLFIAISGQIEKLLKIIAVASGQSLTPMFCVAENLLFHAVIAAIGIYRHPNRFRIGMTHDLADQLLLPAHRAVSLHRLRSQHGIQKVFLQANALQLIGGEFDQCFAERLESQVLAL